MRALVLLLGLTGVVGAASAGNLNSPFNDTDASMGRVMFESRFGGDQPAFTQNSYQLQFGTEHQFKTGVIPFRTEYRPATGTVLLNGMNLQALVANNLGEEGGGFASAMVGWIPVAVVVAAVGFVVVDGHDNGHSIVGSGGF